MYVYVYIFAYVYIYISMYISMYICICLCMHVYKFEHRELPAKLLDLFLRSNKSNINNIYVHVYMYMYMYICESICIFAESMHAFTGIVEHHACADVCVKQML